MAPPGWLRTDITSERYELILEHPPQRQVCKQLEPHTPWQRAVKRQPPSIRMESLRVYCMSFWTAPRRLITALESQSRFRAERSDFGWLD